MSRVCLLLMVPLVWSACQSAVPRADPDPELVLSRDSLPEAEALARYRLRLQPDDRQSQLLLARAQERHGDFAEALPVFERLHDDVWLCRGLLDAGRDATACKTLQGQPALEAVSAYAAFLLRGDKPQAAETALRQTLEHAPMAGREIRTVSRLHYQLGLALRDQQRQAAAEVEFWRALAVQREVLGGSLYLADTLYALGAMKLDQGWSASFQPFFKQALEIRVNLLAAHDWRVVQARGALAACLSAERRFGQSGADLRQAYEIVAHERGAGAPEAAQMRAWWEQAR